MSPKTTHRTRTSSTTETADVAIIAGNFRNGGGGRNRNKAGRVHFLGSVDSAPVLRVVQSPVRRQTDTGTLPFGRGGTR